MSESELRQLLEEVQSGGRTADQALQHLRSGPFRTSNLGFAQVDHHRRLRQGLGEVIFGEGKTAAQVIAIAAEAGQAGSPVLITRLQPEKSAEVAARFPDARVNAAARTVTLHAPAPAAPRAGEPHVAVVAAGTSDLPVAEEAAEVCVAMGIPHHTIYDVGVAGMEGALPSVVAGLLGRPVFAVPTSVGYGANFGGLSALLAMLNCCAPGVTVTNIDNGFSAGFAACQVVRAVRSAAGAPR